MGVKRKKESWEEHQVEMAALACIRCSCGWVHQIENLKGKSDSDLALECGLQFTRHKKDKEDRESKGES